MIKKTPDALPIIGWREWISLPTLGINRIKAKIDTGARTSSLHAVNLKYSREHGKEYVYFTVHPIQGNSHFAKHIKAPLVDERYVKSTSGHKTMRPIVQSSIILGPYAWDLEITLFDRESMGHRFLLSRQAIKKRFLVNVGRSYVLSKEINRKERLKKSKLKK